MSESRASISSVGPGSDMVEEGPLAFVRVSSVEPASSQALLVAKNNLTNNRGKIVDKILQRYRLDDKQISSDSFWDTMKATGAGAMDSGIKATGGVILAKVCFLILSDSKEKRKFS